MISFKDIELKDKELITSYTQQSPRRNCDLHSLTSVAGVSFTTPSLPCRTAS